jgi:hypothetical protein
MDTKCCSKCAHTRLLSCFLKNASASPDSKVFSTCFPCRDQSKQSKKRKALQSLHPNTQSKRRVEPSTTTRPIERAKPRLLNPRPLAVLPPLLDHHPDPVLLPLSESLPLFEARTNPSILPVQRRVQPTPIQSVQPQPILPIPRLLQPPPPRVPQQALQPLQPQAPQPIQSVQCPVRPQPILQVQPPVQHQPQVPQPVQSVQRPVRPQPILPAQPQAAGFLPPSNGGIYRGFIRRWMRFGWRPVAVARSGGFRWI